MQERPGRFRTAKCSLSRSDIIISKCSFPFSAQIRASSLFLQALNSPSYLSHLRAIFSPQQIVIYGLLFVLRHHY